MVEYYPTVQRSIGWWLADKTYGITFTATHCGEVTGLWYSTYSCFVSSRGKDLNPRHKFLMLHIFHAVAMAHTSFTSNQCTKLFLCSYVFQLRIVAIISEPQYQKDISSMYCLSANGKYCAYIYHLLTHRICGAHGSAVGWGTTLQVGRSRVRFLMVSLEFFIDIILPAALWPWGWLSL